MSKYLNIEEYTQHFIQQSNTSRETNAARMIAQGAYDQAERELDTATASGDSLYLLSLIAELKGNSARAMDLCQEAANAGSPEAIALLLPKCETLAEWRETEDLATSIFEATEDVEDLYLVNEFAQLNEPPLVVDDETQQAVCAHVEQQKNNCIETLAVLRHRKDALEQKWKQREEKAKAEKAARERSEALQRAEKARRLAAEQAERDRRIMRELALRDLLRNIYIWSQYIQSGVWIIAIAIVTFMSYGTRASGSANIEMTLVSLACIAAYAFRIISVNASNIADKEIIATPAYCICSVISDILWLPLFAVPAFVMYSTTFSDMELMQNIAKVLVWIVVIGTVIAAIANEDSRSIIITISVILLILFITLVAFDILTWWGIACIPLVIGIFVGYVVLCLHCMKESEPFIILAFIRPAVAITFAYFSALLLGTLTNPISTMMAAYEVILKTFNLL